MSFRVILAAAVLAIATPAAAQTTGNTNTPVIDQREQNQQRRIQQGISSGALTPGEAANLEKREQNLQNVEAADKATGNVTAAQRKQMRRMENRDSAAIARKKHNGKVNPTPPAAQ